MRFIQNHTFFSDFELYSCANATFIKGMYSKGTSSNPWLSCPLLLLLPIGKMLLKYFLDRTDFHFFTSRCTGLVLNCFNIAIESFWGRKFVITKFKEMPLSQRGNLKRWKTQSENNHNFSFSNSSVSEWSITSEWCYRVVPYKRAIHTWLVIKWVDRINLID